MMALAAAASRFPGFSRWVFGGTPGRVQQSAEVYRLQFFTRAEYPLVERLAELIIPGDDTPGARDAGVSEFIDFMVASDPAIQVDFRDGLRWMEAHSRRLYERSFVDLTQEEQIGILEPLAYSNRFRPREEEGRSFFRLFRKYTVMGFYTSRIGLEALEAPALQHVYPDSPGCRHSDDPEHRNLPRGN